MKTNGRGKCAFQKHRSLCSLRKRECCLFLFLQIFTTREKVICVRLCFTMLYGVNKQDLLVHKASQYMIRIPIRFFNSITSKQIYL